eukprot:2805113-Alexandrium_andersonii.AAC.1
MVVGSSSIEDVKASGNTQDLHGGTATPVGDDKGKDDTGCDIDDDAEEIMSSQDLRDALSSYVGDTRGVTLSLIHISEPTRLALI